MRWEIGQPQERDMYSNNRGMMVGRASRGFAGLNRRNVLKRASWFGIARAWPDLAV